MSIEPIQTGSAKTKDAMNYDALLRVLSKQLQDEDEKEDFEERIPTLSKKLVDFSKYFTSMMQIAFDPSLKKIDRIHKISELRCCDGKGMNVSQASNIISRLNTSDARPIFDMQKRTRVFGGAIGLDTKTKATNKRGRKRNGQRAGAVPGLLNYIPPTHQGLSSGVQPPDQPKKTRDDDEDKGTTGDLKNWLPRFIEKSMIGDRFRGVNTKYDIAGDRGASAAAKLGRIFKYFLLKLPMTYGLKLMYSLAGSPIEGVQVEDFVKKMDFTYYILFVLANIPFFGFFANIYTILTAIDDGRIYLACITLIGTILSLFTLHYFDMGLFFKIFYWMDVNYEVDGYKPPVTDVESNVVRITGGEQVDSKKRKKRRVIRRMR